MCMIAYELKRGNPMGLILVETLGLDRPYTYKEYHPPTI